MLRVKSNKEETDNALQSLQIIPGIGPKLAKKFFLFYLFGSQKFYIILDYIHVVIPMFVFYHLLVAEWGRVDRIKTKTSGLRTSQGSLYFEIFYFKV